MQTELVDRTIDSELTAGASAISIEKAKALVDLFARVTTSRDVNAFVGGFTEDCVCRFNCQPEMRGREELRTFMAATLAKYPDSYLCEKTLRSISGNVLSVGFVTTWQDRKTGKPMVGRGSEFWIMRGDQIARWDATFSM